MCNVTLMSHGQYQIFSACSVVVGGALSLQEGGSTQVEVLAVSPIGCRGLGLGKIGRPVELGTGHMCEQGVVICRRHGWTQMSKDRFPPLYIAFARSGSLSSSVLP